MLYINPKKMNELSFKIKVTQWLSKKLKTILKHEQNNVQDTCPELTLKRLKYANQNKITCSLEIIYVD